MLLYEKEVTFVIITINLVGGKCRMLGLQGIGGINVFDKLVSDNEFTIRQTSNKSTDPLGKNDTLHITLIEIVAIKMARQ